MPKFKIPKIPKPDLTKVSREDKKKFLILIAVIVAMLVICIPLIPYFNSLLDPANRQELVNSIQKQGFIGVLIVLGLQVLQVVVAFIPGEVVQILAGVIYGTLGGLLICIIGLLISTTIVYKVVTKLGMPLVQSVVPEKYLEKLEFLNDNKRIDFIVFILFLIPGLPKDVFTYFIPLTGMPFGRFLFLSTVARVPGLIASTYAGAAFLEGNYTGMIVIFVVFGGLGVLGIIFRDQILEFLGAKKQKAKTQIQEFAESRIKGINRLEARRKKGELPGQQDARRFEPESELFDDYSSERPEQPDFALRDEDFDNADAVELEGYVEDDKKISDILPWRRTGKKGASSKKTSTPRAVSRKGYTTAGGNRRSEADGSTRSSRADSAGYSRRQASGDKKSGTADENNSGGKSRSSSAYRPSFRRKRP